jgi:SNF2 family DNA or RNA helicase
MGLGKTIQAIGLACAFRDSWPVLVLVPAVVKLNWVVELERWLPALEPWRIRVVGGRGDVDSWRTADAAFVVATYGLFTQESAAASALAQAQFKMVIADESHYLKTHNAVRTKLVTPLLAAAQHAVLLSGTPMLARPVELYAQISALNKSLVGSYTEYTRHFCAARRGRFGWDVTGASNLDELAELLTKVMIRRKKDEVLTQLPAKIRSRVYLDLDDKAVKGVQEGMHGLSEAGALLNLHRAGAGLGSPDAAH